VTCSTRLEALIHVDPFCHSASVEVNVPAETAFAYMADGIRQGEWTLGSWNRRALGDNLFVGTSLFDGREVYVRIEPRPELLLVDYHVGTAPERLRPVNSARIVPGPSLGRSEGTCIVTLQRWRAEDETDEQWAQRGQAFNTEVFMIKGRLELDF
jgi:hypothetical protein